jgi:hypothetical protein
MDLHRIARLLGGVVVAGQVRAPAPGRAAGDRSMVISPAPDLWGGLHVRLRSDGDPMAAKGHILLALGIPPAPPRRRFPAPPMATHRPRGDRPRAQHTPR